MHGCPRCGHMPKGNPRFCPNCSYFYSSDPLRHTGQMAMSDFVAEDAEVEDTRVEKGAIFVSVSDEEVSEWRRWLERTGFGPDRYDELKSGLVAMASLVLVVLACFVAARIMGGIGGRIAPAEVLVSTGMYWMGFTLALGILVNQHKTHFWRVLKWLDLPPVPKMAWREVHWGFSMPVAIAIVAIIFIFVLRIMNSMRIDPAIEDQVKQQQQDSL